MLQRVASLTLYFLVLLSMAVPSGQLEVPGWVEPARYVIFLALACGIALTSYIRYGLRIPVGIETTLLALFFLLYAASALWGSQMASSYIKSLLVLTALITSLSIASMLPLERALAIIYYALATFIVICVAVVFLWPDIGVDQSWEHAGKWRGLAGQKNGLAAYAAYAAILGVGLPMAGRSTRGRQYAALCLRLAIIALCLIAVYMSGSRGGLMLAAIGLASLIVARLPRIVQRASLIAGIAFCIPFVFLVFASFSADGDKLSVLGLTIDTNSRMKLWQFGVEHMLRHDRLLAGFGMDSFWTPDRLTAFQDIYSWELDNFHNGYITLFIETGGIGFTLFLAGFLALFLLALISIGGIRTPATALAFAVLNMFTVGNLIENELGRSTSLGIYMFLIIAFSLRTHVAGWLSHQHSRPLPVDPRIFGYQNGATPY